MKQKEARWKNWLCTMAVCIIFCMFTSSAHAFVKEAIENTGFDITALSPVQKEEARRALAAFRATRGYREWTPIAVPVAMNIICNDDGSGDVTDATIEEQMTVLNQGFAGSGISFYLFSVNRIHKTAWTTVDSYMKGRDILDALHTRTEHIVSVYVVDDSSNLGGDILGMAILPMGMDEDHILKFIFISKKGLPGGDDMYQEGEILTHEMGHYFGLYHTFENGCTPPGDEVDDTPYEAAPTWGCPLGQDSCPDDPGEDPIHNYMDYTDESCWSEFTPGQWTRMQEMTELWMPTLMLSPANLGALEGVVKDAATGDPISAARVTVTSQEGKSFPIFTDQNGFYKYYALPEGTYTFSVTRYGYGSFLEENISIMHQGNETRNVDLAKQEMAQVSGKITDAATGWPLYARITVKSTSLLPSLSVYTDPFTGSYSMRIPKEACTMDVEAMVSGYAEITDFALAPDASVVEKDFALRFDEFSGMGYTGADILNESFDGDTLPEGWSAVKENPDGKSWEFGYSPVFKKNAAYITAGAKAYLETPAMDATGKTNLFLRYEHYFLPITLTGIIAVEISTDGGSTWEIISQNGPGKYTNGVIIEDITGIAAGKPDVRIRFFFSFGISQSHWQISQVRVYENASPDGGLTAGYIREQTTGKALVDALVSGEEGFTSTSMATPLDAGADDGLYFLYQGSGTREITVKPKTFPEMKDNVEITSGSIARKDFAFTYSETHPDYAIYIDGKDRGITVPNHESLHFTGDFTLETYFCPAPYGEQIETLKKYILLQNQDVVFSIRFWPSGNIDLLINNTNEPIPTIYSGFERPPETPWFHVACAYDFQDKKVRFYLNGEEIIPFGEPGEFLIDPAAPLDPDTPFQVAGSQWNRVDPEDEETNDYTAISMPCKIDEVRVWKTARAPQEIAENCYKSLTGNETGLVLYLPISEVTGNTISDASGSGHVAEINGALWDGTQRANVALQTISGTDPVESVFVQYGTETGRTDDRGYLYFFPAPGTMDITASKYGYETLTQAGVLFGDGEIRELPLDLTSQKMIPVSGKITDGAGPGWPLYCYISAYDQETLTFITSLYTDPLTGAYSVNLAEGRPVYWNIISRIGGYEDVSTTITPETGTSYDYTLTGFYIPGMETTDLLNEPFNDCTLPAGWEMKDNAATGAAWKFDDPSGIALKTPGSVPCFASADSDYEGGVDMDTELISPSIDCSAAEKVGIAFSSAWEYSSGNEIMEVDVSTDNGQSWTPVHEMDYMSKFLFDTIATDITDLCAGQSSVRVRFHYYNAYYDYFWAVDDVRIFTYTKPESGGLVMGNVKDSLTGAYVNGAQVKAADGSGESQKTFPEKQINQAIENGFYILYQPAGEREIVAMRDETDTDTRTVTVTTGENAWLDFTLTANLSHGIRAMRVAAGMEDSIAGTLDHTGDGVVDIRDAAAILMLLAR